MTTATHATTTRPAPLSQAAVGWRYLGASLRHLLGNAGFVGFILALPTAMYLFFSQIYGSDPTFGDQAKLQIMVQMATYGAMGSALSAGNAIQTERSTGWFRQLMLSSLTPTTFFVVRALSALLMILPPVALVLAVGRIDGIELPLGTWFAVAGVALVVLIPFVVMGLVVGLWLKPQTASAATTFLMLGLAMLGGMWVPLEMMPDVLQTVGKVLPSYWAVEMAKLPITGDAIPLTGVLVLVGWTLFLTLLGVLGYRRAVATSKR